MPEPNRFCTNCGARVEPGDAFCINCGAKLETVRTVAVTHAVASAPANSGGNVKKQSPLSMVASVVLILAALYVIFGDMLPGSKGRPVRNYADASARMIEQLDRHESPISLAFDIDKFEEEFSTYRANDVSHQFLYPNVIRRTYQNVLRYDGDPRHGERLALTVLPATAHSTLSGKTSNGYSTLRLTLTMEYFTTRGQEDALQKRVQEVVAALNLTGKSDYEKVRAIYRYICDNVTYDHVHLGDRDYRLQYTAYGALFNHTAVCSGVTELFAVMATAAGVEAHIKGSEDHAWNFVRVGDRYYYLDATWDLGRPESQWAYFLRGKSDFLQNLEELPHRYGLTYDPDEFSSFLYSTDKGFNISEYAYRA